MKYDYIIIGDVENDTFDRFYNFFKNKPIKKIYKLLLFSSGGKGEPAVAISDFIKTHKLKIDIYCIGAVESSAMIILKAGYRRYSYLNCVFMMHLPQIGNGTAENHERHKKKESIYRDLIQSILPNIKLKYAPIYFTAQEALKIGLVDKILTIKLKK